ncbi:plasmid replication protein, CyRepA1 family [Shewanella baltica]|uniref:plasmid replication protein, CyRepA1 family n=1 Tax=Shewanella baltica TaxID=62322 RepID=UPI00217E6508|nr:plasmid replication protein, CyRepA1 family [Shewanella baltica]MCS6257442.1 hypothetical protein [Shewanella baltica]
MQESTFAKFYRERFGSGEAVASYFDAELADDAATIGVNWSLVSNRITWVSGKGGKVNVDGSKLLPGFKNSVGVYASLEKDANGVEFPLITFKTKGGAGETVVFNGLTLLWELFKREKGAKVPQAKLDEWDKKKREREETNARKRDAAKLIQDAENKRRAANVEKELQHFTQLPRAASFVYTDKKLISSILDHVDAREGQDANGNYIALRLQNITGQAVGIQRIYDRHITKKDGSQTNKDFTWGMSKDAAHIIIGDMKSAERIYVTEGFATGASVFLAMQTLGVSCAVIVALDAGNMRKVVVEYQQKAPYLQLLLAVDNDMWKQRQGKGNAGILVAMDLLAEHDEVRAYAPDFAKVDHSYQPTDWNDLHVRAGLKEVVRQLKGQLARVKCDGDLFEKSLERLKYIAFSDVMPAAVKCVLAGMQVGMPKYRPSDIVTTIKTCALQAGISSDHLNLKQLAKKANAIWCAKVKEAQEFRSFSSRITRADCRPEHIEYHQFNKTVIDDEVLNHIKQLEGIIVLRFQMGSRKTQGVIKPVMWEYRNALVTAHRISLIGGIVDALNSKPKDSEQSEHDNAMRELMSYSMVANYQEPSIKDMMPGINKLACCINSILKPEFSSLLNNLDAICIDEAAQTLRHVTAGGAIKYPVAVFNRWLDLMATTKSKVILADADANDILVEFCELGLKKRNAHLKELHGENFIPQKIHVIDGRTDCSDTSIYYTDGDTAFHKVSEDVGAGNRVLVANDSAKDGEKLFIDLQTKYPDKKGLFIALDTKEDRDVEMFTDNPNVESMKYDYVIYSPSISSGVSIENGHFNRHYGIFRGTVAPSDAMQMIRRDRKAREFILGLSTMHSNREESAMAMWLGMILANDNQLEVELNRESGKIELKTKDLDFDRFRLDLIAQENKAKNDFANNLLCCLYADGYKIKSLDTTDIDKEKGKMAKEVARDMLKATDIARHLDQPTPTAPERDQLLSKMNLCRDEKAKLNRWDIENALMLPVDDESIEFHHKGGLNKVRLFELLNMSPEKAQEFDAAEVAAGVQPSNRMYLVKQRQALRDFFEVAGFDWTTGKGESTEESLTAAIEHLIAGDKIHLFNTWYKFGGYINPFSRNLKAVNKAKSILEALGLKMCTLQLGRNTAASAKRQRYLITLDSWDAMSDIHRRRVESAATAFKLEHLDMALIHSSPDNSIDTVNEMDQAKAKPTKVSSWLDVFNIALENLKIPLVYSAKIAKELCRSQIYRGDYAKHGVDAVQHHVGIAAGRLRLLNNQP